MKKEKQNLWILMGASGRIGRMVMRHWRLTPPVGLRVLAQQRGMGGGLQWSPIDGPGPLVDFAAAQGRIAGLIVLSGVTPESGADLSVNAKIVEAAVTAAAAVGIDRLLVASSSAVYGIGHGVPHVEDGHMSPANDYGRAKLVAEQVCSKARDAGIDVCTLRIGNVAGADALLLNAARSTSAAPLRLDQFADGRGPQRSYIGPATLADVFATLAGQSGALPRQLNIAAPNPVSMESLAIAAGACWHFVQSPVTAYQTITLDCSRLSDLHHFPTNASDPVQMVAEWHRLKDPT